jgi:hypothetical protein
MDKIASPQELHGELRNLAAYCGSAQPSREVVASKLRELAVRVASGVFPIEKLKRLTDDNNHSEALILGAKSLGLSHVVKKLELVKALQDLEGHLPHGLSDYRYGLYNEVMKHAKQTLSPEEYEEFHGCF